MGCSASENSLSLSRLYTVIPLTHPMPVNSVEKNLILSGEYTGGDECQEAFAVALRTRDNMKPADVIKRLVNVDYTVVPAGPQDDGIPRGTEIDEEFVFIADDVLSRTRNGPRLLDPGSLARFLASLRRLAYAVFGRSPVLPIYAVWKVPKLERLDFARLSQG